jgi:hypothetical protein
MFIRESQPLGLRMGFPFEDKNRSLTASATKYASLQVIEAFDGRAKLEKGPVSMSKEADNKATVVRWFTEFWGKEVNLAVVDEIAAPDSC